MTSPHTILFLKGLELNNRILERAKTLETKEGTDRKLLLSFDLYCLLLEYFIILYHASDNVEVTLEEILKHDQLQIEVGNMSFSLEVNFFSPPNTLLIR